jgi:5'-3' exonuclease
MGVPGLFSYLRKYNKKGDSLSTIKSVLPNPDEEVHLYLDFNGAIYQVIRPELKTEEAFIIHILQYLDNLITIFNINTYNSANDDFTISNPITKVFIAIDGVPPRAKMEQQRMRRFHSVARKTKLLHIHETYSEVNEPSSTNFNIDTNMITPGTQFMQKLKIAINDHLQKKEATEQHPFKGIEVYFSDWSCPGEGEHKIIDHLRDNPPAANVKSVIYGLDGDLIMLSMGTQIDNIYLIREAYEYGQYAFQHEGYPYLFMDINCLKLALLNECQKKLLIPIKHMSTHDINRFIDDYIVLTMLLGNDFMPKIPWISIKQNGHQILLDAYLEVHNGTESSQNPDLKYLFNRKTSKINIIMLADVFSLLSRKENGLITQLYEKRQRSKINIHPEATEKERQETLLEFLPLQHINIEKEINPTQQQWRGRYYKICHEMIGTPANIDKICTAYLKTLVWNANYYMNGCISWEWYYPYHYSPTLADIYYYLKDKQTHSHISYNLGKPATPQTLLLMVLPKKSSNLMAKSIADTLYSNDLITVYFPDSYGIHLPLHTRYYECTPKIPKLDIKYASRLVNKCKLTNEENERNIIGKLIYYK